MIHKICYPAPCLIRYGRGREACTTDPFALGRLCYVYYYGINLPGIIASGDCGGRSGQHEVNALEKRRRQNDPRYRPRNPVLEREPGQESFKGGRAALHESRLTLPAEMIHDICHPFSSRSWLCCAYMKCHMVSQPPHSDFHNNIY